MGGAKKGQEDAHEEGTQPCMMGARLHNKRKKEIDSRNPKNIRGKPRGEGLTQASLAPAWKRSQEGQKGRTGSCGGWGR